MSTKTHERPTLDFNTRTAAILRNLIGNSKRTAREIGEAVGISNVTISRTLTGKTRLSRKNFDLLRDELCTNKHEHRLLERAYDDPTFANFMLDEIPTKRGEQASYASAKILAALRADEASLRKSARSYLEESGLNYESDYVIGDAWLDFVVTLHVEDYDSDVKLKIPIERQTGIILERGSERRDSSMLSFYLMLNTLVDEVVVLHPDEESGKMTEEHPKEKRIPISQLSAYLAELRPLAALHQETRTIWNSRKR